MIAALIGQKLSAFEAAQLGVFVHGLAGDIARDHHGEVGMIAGDIVDALPDAFAHLMPDPDLCTDGRCEPASRREGERRLARIDESEDRSSRSSD